MPATVIARWLTRLEGRLAPDRCDDSLTAEEYSHAEGIATARYGAAAWTTGE